MDRLDKQTFIQQKAVENRGDSNEIKIFWSRHAIVEMVNDRNFIVTVYLPSSERWENDWQTRK